MKRFLFLVACLVSCLVLTISSILAQEDYSNVKGDFKIFALGDSEETIKQKIDYLVNKNEAKRPYYSYDFIDTKILGYNVQCYFQYFQDALYQIDISFPEYTANYIDTTIKSTIENDIKPMFTSLFGPPTTSYGFPSIFELTDGYVTFCYKWVLPKKTIYIGVSSYEYQYKAKIILSDNALVKAKADFEKQQKQKTQESSKSDF